jgi:signal peptidase II
MAPKVRWFLLALSIALPLDQLSKTWIVKRFHYGEELPVIPGFFDLTHVRNPGGAFSFFADGAPEHRMLFFVGSTLIAIGLLIAFLVRHDPHERLAPFALGAILGGALGNLIDRLVYGEVIDFLNFHLLGGYTWPTFNFADSAIVVGVAVLLADVFLHQDAVDGAEDYVPEPHSGSR